MKLKSSRQYARRSGPRKPGSRSPVGILMHREILGAPSRKYVDHKNHNGLDNRRENIRICTNQQNSANSRLRDGRTWKGVHLDTRGKFRSSIGISGRTVLIGIFDSELHAAAAYNNKAREAFGEFALVNNLPNEDRLISEALAIIANPKKRKGGSRFRGVCWSSSKRKWRSTKNGAHIGYFATEEEAYAAYCGA